MEDKYEKFKAVLKRGLVDTLVGLQTRMIDRDDTTLLSLPYDNLGDWLTHNALFLTGGRLHQSFDRYVVSLLRSYITAQIRGLFPYAPEEQLVEFQDVASDIITANIASYKRTIETQHPHAWRTIEESFKPTIP
jgi:hypothetical protein